MEELKYIALGLILAWPIGYIIYAFCKNLNEHEDDIESLKQRIFELEDEVKKLKKQDYGNM